MSAPRGYAIRPLGPDDLVWMAETVTRQQAENGRAGPYFSPVPADAPPVMEDLARIERWRRRMPLRLDEPDFLRVFGLSVAGTDALVGQVSVHGQRFASELHRVSVGIGIERAHQRKGGGRALMLCAIAMARAARFAWMDLGVFEDNTPARALYAALGFEETGRVMDRFRVDGVSLADVQMSLDLRKF